MIDEKKLLQQIADFKRCQKSKNCDYLTGYICALSVVEGMIASQPKVGEWIPVSENPPEEGLYLVECEDVGIQVKYYHDDGTWMSMFDVLAWQPLPEPYKGE